MFRSFVLLREGGGPPRFWNIVQRPPRPEWFASASVTVCSGAGSGPGEMATTNFDDEETARAEYERLVAEKLAEGYAETTDEPLCGPYHSPTRQALEDALAENPDDLAAHMAYADHLMELGDPRGELIQVQLALEDELRSTDERNALRRREQVLLQERGRMWLGPMAGYWIDKMDEVATPLNFCDRQELTWRRGWVDSLVFHDGDPESAEAAVRRRDLLRLLRELHLGHCYHVDGGPDVLLKGIFLGNVRVFRIGRDPGDEAGECYYESEMNAEDFLDRMPRLEELRLFARQMPMHRLFSRPMPTLKKLLVYHGWEIYPLQRLAANTSLANLTHLACWPRGQSNDREGVTYITRAGFAAVVRSPNLPKLQHLQMCLTEVGDWGMRVLVDSGILSRLKTLNLHGGTVTDKGARILAACPELRNLDLLRLSENYLTSAGIEALNATGVRLLIDRQHGRSERAEKPHLDDGDSE